MMLKPFDPWKNSLCTCPSKLSLNPYTGCSHGCLYCYASSYIPRFSECRPKRDLLKQLERDISKAAPGTLITLSGSTDPYQPAEKELGITSGCLKILRSGCMAVQVVTKSDMVCEDIDLLSGMRSVVNITVTTLKDSLSRRLEPAAPLPGRRLQAIRKLRDNGIPVSVRVDPIIPGINDSEIKDIVSEVCSAGAQHITSSTYKARPDSMKRLCTAFPAEGVALKALFKRGERIGGSLYLPEELRLRIMHEIEVYAAIKGMSFACCREGLRKQRKVSCDGSHLIQSI
ncbi:MAG: radical SAM protein [Methanotrichaceae archaeon]